MPPGQEGNRRTQHFHEMARSELPRVLSGWFGRGRKGDRTSADGRADALAAWRAEANRVARAGSHEDVRAMLERRAALGIADEESEVETERLNARLDLLDLD